MNEAVIRTVKQSINSGVATMPKLAVKAGVTEKHLHEVLESRKAGSLSLWSGVAKALNMQFQLVPVVNGGLFDDEPAEIVVNDSPAFRKYVEEIVYSVLRNNEDDEGDKPWHGATEGQMWRVTFSDGSKSFAIVEHYDKTNELVFKTSIDTVFTLDYEEITHAELVKP